MCHANNMLGAEAKVWIPAHIAVHTPWAQHQAQGAPIPAAPAAEAGTGVLLFPALLTLQGWVNADTFTHCTAIAAQLWEA